MHMPYEGTSTLLATERAMRPFVMVATFGCDALLLVQFCLLYAHAPAPIFLLCAMPSLACALSNLYYLLTHEQPTVGMIPVALLSLLPCSLALGLTQDLTWSLRVLFVVLSIPLLALLICLAYWFAQMHSAYSAHPSVAPNATLIVLGGAIRNGRPRPTLAKRLDTAARLWHESHDRTIVVSGGPTPTGPTTEADAMACYLQEKGISDSSIVHERRARNTSENISLSCALLDKMGKHEQRCVVSSDYHLWRALRDARKCGYELTPIAAPVTREGALQQWCREALTIMWGR